MYINNVYIQDLKEDDIKVLLENRIRESRTLEYKRQFNISDDKDKARLELLCDITALYNTDGGCIIYGIEEEKDDKNTNTGYPLKFFSQSFENHDKLTLQIQSIVRGNTSPNIANLIIRFVLIDDFFILIIGIPRGLGLPVMVTLNDANRFYRRNNAGKYLVDVYELNQLFMQQSSIREKASQFSLQRVKHVAEGKVFPLFNTEGAFFLHAVPMDFQSEIQVDLSIIETSEIAHKIKPIEPTDVHKSKGFNSVYNYDGFQTCRFKQHSNDVYAYNQFFRNGIIEFYTTDFYDNEESKKLLFGSQLVEAAVLCIEQAISIWKKFKLAPPFMVFMHLNAPGSYFLFGSTSVGLLPRRPIVLPMIFFDKFEMSKSEIFSKMKKHFDILWQSAGQKECPDEKAFFTK